MTKVFLILLLFCCELAVAQSDTLIIYLAKDGHETTSDSAHNFTKLYRNGNTWHGKDYYSKTNMLRSEGDYAENNLKKPVGDFKVFTEKGTLDYIASYTEGTMTEINCFYKNGAKRSWATFDEKGVIKQKGWDEAGKEIKNFVVMRYAHYKGGNEGWNRYLMKNMNRQVALEAGAPVGQYTVQISFLVTPEGAVTKAKALSVPPQCKPCAAEALDVVRNSKDWEPAIRNNEPVEFPTIQPFTFVVPEVKGKK